MVRRFAAETTALLPLLHTQDAQPGEDCEGQVGADGRGHGGHDEFVAG